MEVCASDRTTPLQMGECPAPLHTKHAPESFHAVRWEGVQGRRAGEGAQPGLGHNGSLFGGGEVSSEKPSRCTAKEGYVSEGKDAFAFFFFFPSD